MAVWFGEDSDEGELPKWIWIVEKLVGGKE